MAMVVLGALLVVAGVVYMAQQALWPGRLSSVKPPSAPDADTLEPRSKSVAFDLRANSPGIALFAIGGALLLFGAGL